MKRKSKKRKGRLGRFTIAAIFEDSLIKGDYEEAIMKGTDVTTRVRKTLVEGIRIDSRISWLARCLKEEYVWGKWRGVEEKVIKSHSYTYMGLDISLADSDYHITIERVQGELDEKGFHWIDIGGETYYMVTFPDEDRIPYISAKDAVNAAITFSVSEGF